VLVEGGQIIEAPPCDRWLEADFALRWSVDSNHPKALLRIWIAREKITDWGEDSVD
jgi:hypothetical protein